MIFTAEQISPTSVSLPPVEAPRGVVYVCTYEREYAECCRMSIWSLRRICCDMPVLIVTDQPEWFKDADDLLAHLVVVPKAKSKWESRRWKTSLHRWSIFNTSLFVDCDTFFVRRPTQPWTYDKGGAVTLAIDPFPMTLEFLDNRLESGEISVSEYLEIHEQVDDRIPFLNSGVMAWKRSADSTSFFHEWNKTWEQPCFRKRDQFAMAAMLARTGIKYDLMPKAMNYRHYEVNSLDRAVAEANIIHPMHAHRKRVLTMLSNRT